MFTGLFNDLRLAGGGSSNKWRLEISVGVGTEALSSLGGVLMFIKSPVHLIQVSTWDPILTPILGRVTDEGP